MPVDLLTLVAFLPASLALNLTPGVDMLFSAAQGHGELGHGFAVGRGHGRGPVVLGGRRHEAGQLTVDLGQPGAQASKSSKASNTGAGFSTS